MNMAGFRADEGALKAKFLEHLLARGVINRRSIVANEYLLNGAARRADLAILTGQTFIGVEIKSEFDSLARLLAQVTAYRRVFDVVMVLVAQRHERAASEMLPPSVALFVADEFGNIQQARLGGPDLDLGSDERRQAIIDIMPKATLAKLTGRTTGRQSRRDLNLAASALAEKVLRKALFREFRHRYAETSKVFWSLVPNRKQVSPSYLSVLSRSGGAQRLPTTCQHDELKSKWENWVSQREVARAA